MTSSRCSSEAGDGARRVLRPARRRGEWVLRWLPTLLLGVVVVYLYATRDHHGPRAPRRTQLEPLWFPLGSGEVDFLGEKSPYQLVREVGKSRCRIEEPTGVAFESRELDRVLQMFLRQKLAGLRLDETLEIRFRDERPEAQSRGTGSDGGGYHIAWTVSPREEEREGETWYSTGIGESGRKLYARGLEDLKDKILREWAREVASLYEGLLFP